MKYNKEVFKKHFGKPYIDGMIWYSISAVGGFLFALMFGLFGWYLSPILAYPLMFHFGLWLFPGLWFVFCYYVQALQRSRRQRQWIEKDLLYVKLVPVDGFVWGAGMESHKKLYIVQQVSGFVVKNTKIIVCGKILLNDTWNGHTKEKMLDKFSIPRNFLGEEELLAWLNKKKGQGL